MGELSFQQAIRSSEGHNDNAALQRLGKRPQLKVSLSDRPKRGLHVMWLTRRAAKLWLHVNGGLLHNVDGELIESYNSLNDYTEHD